MAQSGHLEPEAREGSVRCIVALSVSVVLFFVVFCGAAAGVESDEGRVAPAFQVELRVKLSEQGSTPQRVVALVEGLQKLDSLASFEVALSMSKGVLGAHLRAHFAFSGLEELSDWRGSKPIKDFMASLGSASDAAPQLSVYGSLPAE